MGAPPSGGGGRIGGPGPNNGGGFFSWVGNFFKKLFGYGEEEVQPSPVARPAPGLNQRYSNVPGGLIAKPMFREASANAGNSTASRLDEIPSYGTDWSGKAFPPSKTPDTLGILEVPDQGDVYLQSQYAGPSALMSKGTPGMNGNIKSHVETHAASVMRLEGINEATLYLNRAPCPGPQGCQAMLERMLPPGATIKQICFCKKRSIVGVATKKLLL